LGTDYKDIIIAENGNINSIPKGYGENDWTLSYGKNQGDFRHFKTNNWHDHFYSFKFFKRNEKVFCEVEIDGPNKMDGLIIQLDRKTKAAS